MGLTIHWNLEAPTNHWREVCGYVNELREAALKLPFQHVSDILDFQGNDCDDSDPDDPHRWLKIQCARYVKFDEDTGTSVEPIHITAFTAQPGEGCEPANFGFCRYPAKITVEGRNYESGLSGWTWSSFCKTQYASNPVHDGVDNFLQCHLAVINLLDAARQLGVLKRVIDEGEFWESRDSLKLESMAEYWNRMAAGVAGKLKDEFGESVKCAITEFPNYERLEAERAEEEAAEDESSEHI